MFWRLNMRGIHRGPVNSPHKWPVTRKMFPFDDVIMGYLYHMNLDWGLPYKRYLMVGFLSELLRSYMRHGHPMAGFTTSAIGCSKYRLGFTKIALGNLSCTVGSRDRFQLPLNIPCTSLMAGKLPARQIAGHWGCATPWGSLTDIGRISPWLRCFTIAISMGDAPNHSLNQQSRSIT